MSRPNWLALAGLPRRFGALLQAAAQARSSSSKPTRLPSNYAVP